MSHNILLRTNNRVLGGSVFMYCLCVIIVLIIYVLWFLIFAYKGGTPLRGFYKQLFLKVLFHSSNSRKYLTNQNLCNLATCLSILMYLAFVQLYNFHWLSNYCITCIYYTFKDRVFIDV